MIRDWRESDGQVVVHPPQEHGNSGIVEPLLAAKVIVDRRQIGARGIDNVANAGRREAMLGEFVSGGVEEEPHRGAIARVPAVGIHAACCLKIIFEFGFSLVFIGLRNTFNRVLLLFSRCRAARIENSLALPGFFLGWRWRRGRGNGSIRWTGKKNARCQFAVLARPNPATSERAVSPFAPASFGPAAICPLVFGNRTPRP